MTISKLVEKLNAIQAARGDLEVVTDDYAGGDYELNDAEPEIRENDNRAFRPVVVIRASGRY